MTVGDRRVAYEVAGDGPLLLCPVRYDRLGVGVSERELRDEDLTVDGEVEVIRAVG